MPGNNFVGAFFPNNFKQDLVQGPQFLLSFLMGGGRGAVATAEHHKATYYLLSRYPRVKHSDLA